MKMLSPPHSPCDIIVVKASSQDDGVIVGNSTRITPKVFQIKSGAAWDWEAREEVCLLLLYLATSLHSIVLLAILHQAAQWSWEEKAASRLCANVLPHCD